MECDRLTSDIHFLGQKARTGHRQDRDCSCVEEFRLVTGGPIVEKATSYSSPGGVPKKATLLRLRLKDCTLYVMSERLLSAVGDRAPVRTHHSD